MVTFNPFTYLPPYLFTSLPPYPFSSSVEKHKSQCPEGSLALLFEGSRELFLSEGLLQCFTLLSKSGSLD